MYTEYYYGHAQYIMCNTAICDVYKLHELLQIYAHEIILSEPADIFYVAIHKRPMDSDT